MDRREREAILGEWGVRDDTLHARQQREVLARELADSPLKGRAIRARWRNWRPEADSYIAALGGPLPYMRRLRAIHDETEAHLARLDDAWRELAGACGDDEATFARRWRATATGWRFDAVNELIERHNRWYPVEARLPMDPRTRDYALVGGKPYRRRPLDAAWILERFPAELRRAAA
ncbi:MAG TPA: hypothetical protein VLB86_16620 [Gaiellaceae bacterium]|nr:hypothetical protein [Gaiellaceae bacterium]